MELDDFGHGLKPLPVPSIPSSAAAYGNAMPLGDVLFSNGIAYDHVFPMIVQFMFARDIGRGPCQRNLNNYQITPEAEYRKKFDIWGKKFRAPVGGLK